MELKKKYTIEHHLERFNENEDCKFICGSWNVEKPQYVSRLKAVAQRYPYYSLHDCTHSETILRSIEYLLGEDRIKLLSPTDTWLILQCAYTHDIGMALSAKEMIKKFSEDKSKYEEKLGRLCRNNQDIQQAWEYISQLIENDKSEKPYDVSAYLSGLWEENNSSKKKALRLAKHNLNASWYEKSVQTTGYFALISQSLLRSEHAEESVKVLSEQLDEKIYNGLIQRWFRQLSFKIGALHTGTFDEVMELPQKVNGLCGDYAHPRFVAVLLRLGDLLDLDSNRFNQAQLDVIGEPDYESFVQQIKHSAISELCVTPQKITVNAELKMNDVAAWAETTYAGNPDTKEETDLPKKLCLRALKELRDWLSWLEEETKNFRVNWLEIVPEDFTGSCPILDKRNLCMLLDGKPVDEETLNLHYEITSKRATEIIEGASLYEKEKIVFIRELIQNSADATCRQLYRDIAENNGKGKNKSKEKLWPWTEIKDSNKYRIDIDIEEEKSDNPQALIVSIRDRGIGISENMLKKMRYIGNIVSVGLNKEAEKMPQCIKPTGNFGIGMQSVFQVSDTFDVETRTRFGAGIGDSMLRKMKFYSNKIDGSIISYDLEMDSEINREFGYGTKTTIEIPFSDLDECIKPIYDTLDFPVDLLADPAEAYKKAIKNYAERIYSNNLVPLYVNNERVGENEFGSKLIFVQTLPGESESKRYLVYEDKNYSDTFSFYDENIGVMISYRWPQNAHYGYNGNTDIYYKSIFVDDSCLKSEIKIPFFDTRIYFYMGTPENYLEINRDRFLREKYDNIASRIRLTHINAMKALFASDKDTSLVWEAEDAEQTEYRQSVKKYMSVIVRNYSKDIDYSGTKYLSSNELYPNKSNCHSYYANQQNYLRYMDSKQPGEFSYIDKMLQENPDIWFVDSNKLYRKDTALISTKRYGSWHFLCHDRFVTYPEIAIRKAQTITTSEGQVLLIYKAGKRTGGTVEISEEDYWEYVTYKYEFYSKNPDKTGDIRLVFPGTGRYEAAEVYCLPSGIKSREALKFNRYFIAPMNARDLRAFLNQKFEDVSEISNYLMSLVPGTDCEKITKEDYWKKKQSLLTAHVEKYSAKQIHSNPFREVDLGDICRCYVNWLWDFYKNYHKK